MWNSRKSTVCSLVCTRIFIVLLILCAVFLPRIIEFYAGYAFNAPDSAGLFPLKVVLYMCCIPAAAALVCLDRMLTDIRKGEVFTSRNVRLLRIISWSCFAAAAMLLAAGKYYILFLCAAAIAAFIGLILRVVKNVIEEASEIKNENDYTI